jgi:broad specificity phosphatase PhoE
MKPRIACLLSIVLAFSAFGHEEEKKAGPTTILIVRHAEAEPGDSPDPSLSDAGRARAKALAAVAANAGVGAVYATQYARTKETAAPAAAGAGVSVIESAVARTTLAEQSKELGRRIASEHAGGTVLVVGHSNTVPLLVAALGGVTIPEIAHTEYDRLYVIVLDPGKPPRVIAAKY